MCWTIYKFPKRKKAKKDVPIFKILGKHQRAFFYPEFKYTLGKKYKTTKMKNYLSILYEYYILKHGVTIHKAFHSYSGNLKLDITESDATIHLKNDRFEIYHDYEQPVVAYGVIPKGATYYVNEKGEIVSNEIVLYSLKPLNKTNKQ
jgi:hypothetical protein